MTGKSIDKGGGAYLKKLNSILQVNIKIGLIF